MSGGQRRRRRDQTDAGQILQVILDEGVDLKVKADQPQRR